MEQTIERELGSLGMGIGPEHLTGAYAGWLASEGWLKRGDGMLDMGAQELFCAAKPESVNDLVTRFGGQPYLPAELARIANRGLAGEAMIRAGFRYASVDIKPYPFGIRLDLNRDQLPAEHHGRYRLVTNHGTSEHILNQWLFLQAMHDAAAEGALMYHSMPFCGEHEHGIVQSRPSSSGRSARPTTTSWSIPCASPSAMARGRCRPIFSRASTCCRLTGSMP